MEIDINSDRYRICPGCEKDFMAKNRGRIYCTSKCFNDHYNNHRRDKAAYFIQTLKSNIEILDSLLSDGREILISAEELAMFGFAFENYSDRQQVDRLSLAFYMWYGPYRTNLTLDHRIKIVEIHE